MIIRDFTKKDIEKIIELRMENAKFHTEFALKSTLRDEALNYFTKHTQNALGNKNAKLILAEFEGKIIAYAISFINREHPIFNFEKEAQIEDIYVVSKHQNSKIGSKLIIELENYFKTKNINKIGLSVYAQNIVGHKFWLKNQYQCEFYKMYKFI